MFVFLFVSTLYKNVLKRFDINFWQHIILGVNILYANLFCMLQEDRAKLSTKAQDMTRAIDSLNEEMTAIEYYIQRAEACSDPELKEILLHNSKEEKEHAAMILEWIRRQDGEVAHELKDNLFSEGKIVKH